MMFLYVCVRTQVDFNESKEGAISGGMVHLAQDPTGTWIASDYRLSHGKRSKHISTPSQDGVHHAHTHIDTRIHTRIAAGLAIRVERRSLGALALEGTTSVHTLVLTATIANSTFVKICMERKTKICRIAPERNIRYNCM